MIHGLTEDNPKLEVELETLPLTDIESLPGYIRELEAIGYLINRENQPAVDDNPTMPLKE